MKFNLSTNIGQGVNDNFNYIVTPNAQKVYGNIVDSFQSGIHAKNGADCYSKNGDAVTVPTWQS